MSPRDSREMTRSKQAPKTAQNPPKSTAAETDRERSAWRRDADAHDVTSRLGQRIRGFREAAGLSLTAASEATGIPSATLSRIETNKMAPTFSVLVKLMTGLKLSWPTLMGPHGAQSPDQQVSISLPDTSDSVSISGYSYIAPHVNSPLSSIVQPLIFDVSARTVEEAGGLQAHQGIEFTYVLKGTLQLHFVGREPQLLPVGGTALFNCELPHAYVAGGRGPTRVLNLVARDPMMIDESEIPFGERLRQDQGG